MPIRSLRRSGFTLAEVVIALGLIALVVLAVMGLLGPANRSIARVLATDQAIRMTPAVQATLDATRTDETESERFARWYQAVQPRPAQTNEFIQVADNNLLILFSYRAELPGDNSAIKVDPNYGLPVPFAPANDSVWADARLGVDYVIWDAALTLEEFLAFLPSEGDRSGAIVGEILAGVLFESEANPAPNPLSSYTVGTGNDTYPEAVVAAELAYYTVPRLDDNGLRTALGTQSNPATPIHSINIAFNR